MIFVLAGILLIAVNVFALTRDRKMNDKAKSLGDRLHSRFPSIVREPGYYEDMGPALNVLGLAAGIALILWGIVA